MATAYGGADAPLDTAVVISGRSSYTATTSVVADERHHLLSNSNARHKQHLSLGAWNVRTANGSDSSIRPERATALVCHELEKTGIDICALREVRRPGMGNIVERSHTIFWSGGEERTAGVGFAISNRLAAQGRKAICYRDKSQSCSKLLHQSQAPTSKCLFYIKNKKTSTRPSKKLNTRLDDGKKVLLQQFLDEKLSTCNTNVDELRVVLQNAAARVFGKKKRMHNDWFDDQDDGIQKLLKDKYMDRHVLRRPTRELKNNWFRHSNVMCIWSTTRVFDSHDLTAPTKVAVYNQRLMPLLMYGSETWTLYRHEVRQLRTIQQRHLRLILNIKWDDYISSEEVLRRADVEDMEVMLVRTRLRWLGHVSRMDNDRLVKQFLYFELAHGSRPVGRPKVRFKDTCKRVLKCRVVLDRLLSTVNNRAQWKRLTREVCDAYNSKRIQDYEKRRVRRRAEQRKTVDIPVFGL
ncbi:hypothetical protein AWC38_SpisGene14894 [Stylophora pistillata]|uniref:Endonuclease/exonuclease/phosphatase domain-containing protein n=1 Tax=Stylophora pistillata TaxID=50429 RepID=A0A2B4RQD0_STYPI|nr:hypothetical protein AWC38_SpisGene14894 [Stylophora pistillata]